MDMVHVSKTIILSMLLALIIISSLVILNRFIPVDSTAMEKKVILRIATTTSLDATGLLDVIKKEFEVRNPDVNITWVAVGTGQAIAIGKRGDVDLIITHDRQAEDQFIRDGFGVHGVTFAWNDFIILGPEDDPANVTLSSNAVEAFKKIYESGETGRIVFISRGDRSGTNLRELGIWSALGLNVTGKIWYIESGQGMGQTLIMANEKRAYTLSDRATFLSMKNLLSLKIVFEGDPILINLYRIIPVNPEKFSSAQYKIVEKFVMFIVSEEGQNIIGNYTKNGFRLFNPAFGKLKELGINDYYENEQVEYWINKMR